MYQVGQILYIVSPGVIYPVQVIEQVVKKRLDGETISYTVSLPTKKEAVALETLDGDVFQDYVAARDDMMQNATAAIDYMVSSAVELSVKAFGVKDAKTIPIQPLSAESGSGDIITLPDGKIARLKIAE